MRITRLRTRPQWPERWLWVVSALIWSGWSLAYTSNYEHALSAARADTFSCGLSGVEPGINAGLLLIGGVVVPAASGILALLLRQHLIVELTLAASLPIALVHLMLLDNTLVNLRLHTSTLALIPEAERHVLVSVIILGWLFALLLREVLPTGRQAESGGG